MGDYKLVEVFETGSLELYNLRNDVGEQKDLAGAMPELAASMKKMLHDWRENSGSKMPVPNSDYVQGKDWRNRAD